MKKYIVRAGDTMWSISKSTGVRLNLLVAANPQVRDPNHLQPGTIVAVPELNKTKSKQRKKRVATQVMGTSETKSLHSTNPAHHTHSPQYAGFVWPHVVRPNDTWASIAEQYGVTMDQLQLLNDTDSVTALPGDIVFVPSLPLAGTTALDEAESQRQGQPPVSDGGPYKPDGWSGVDTMGTQAPVAVPWYGTVPPYGYTGIPEAPLYGPNVLPYGYGPVHYYAPVPGSVVGVPPGMMPYMGPEQFAPGEDAAEPGPMGPPSPGINSGPHAHFPIRGTHEHIQADTRADVDVELPFSYEEYEPYTDSHIRLGDFAEASSDETRHPSDDWLESSTWDAVMETPWHVTDVRRGTERAGHHTLRDSLQDSKYGYSDDDDKPPQQSD
jgi:LysM repeat protein